jgi:hypothetical protein
MPVLPARVSSRSGGVQRDLAAMARNQRLFIQLFYGASLWLCVFLQAFIQPDFINIASAVICAVTGTLVASLMLGPRAFSSLPLSAFSVVGVNVVTTSGALWFQTLGWRALTFNLDVPLQTFMFGSAFSIACALTHALYFHWRGLHALRDTVSRSFFEPLGLFDAPATSMLWMMGGVGVLAMWFTGTAEARQGIEFGNLGGKFGEILTPFAVTPFLAPFARALLERGNAAKRRVNWAALGAYFALLVVIAMARNSRSTFANIFAIVGLCLLMAIVSGRILISRKSLLLSSAVGFVLLLVAPVFSEVSAAILINRASRGEVSAGALIASTIETFNNKAAIENFEARRRVLTSGYSELYIDNEFLGRFVTTKYIDLNVKHSDGLNEGQLSVARQAFADRLLATLPTPFLRLLGLGIEKENLQYSGGDLYRFLASSRSLGGFSTGSPIVDGMVVFGPFFWPATVVIFIVAFTMIDALTLPSWGSGFPISAVAAISLPYYFINLFTKDSMAGVLGWFIRGYWQSIITYLIFFYLMRVLVRSAPARLQMRRSRLQQ